MKTHFQHLTLLLFLSSLLILTKQDQPNIEIFTTDSDNQKYTIFTNGIVQTEWDSISQPCSACHPPDAVIEPTSKNERSFGITNNGTSDIIINGLSVTSQSKIIMSPGTSGTNLPVTIGPNESQNFIISYNCDNEAILDRDLDGWGYLEITLSVNQQPVSFNYMKICTVENRQGFDYSIYVILLVAIIVVAAATRQKKTLLGDQAQNMDEIKPMHAVYFIVFASISLMTLYFFSQYIKGILTLIFFFYALTGCSIVFAQWTERYVIHNAVWTKHYQVKGIGAVNLHSMVCFLVSLAVVIAWYITKTWYLNNVIGLSIVCLVFKIVKLPSLKVAYLLLGLAFLYDIFWVFISKPIFGESVMVVAATALDLPIKIEWPYLGSTPFPRCSILGLGDMVLPGFFVTYNYRFGLYKKSNTYYLSSVLAYILGLVLCGGFLIFMQMGQPALLYLVPCMLGAATFISLRRGEFKEMWEGIPDNYQYREFNSDPLPSAIQLGEAK